MQTRRLGQSGLALSTLSLGTLTWGRDTELEEARDIYARFAEVGGTTLDIPSSYRPEAIATRGETIATVIADGPLKDPLMVLHSIDPTPSVKTRSVAPTVSAPCSRRSLLRSLDADLTALGRRNVDVWVVHGPRLGVPYREVADTLLAAVESGRVTYVGLAGMDPWDYGCVSALLAGTSAPVRAIASPLSLLRATPTTQLLSHCLEQGAGFIALAPLAGGALTGKYRHSTPPDSRAASAHLGEMVSGYLGAEQSRVIEAVSRVAEGLGISPAAVSVSWALAQQPVATCAIGPRTLPQFDSILDGYETRLPRELREALADVALP